MGDRFAAACWFLPPELGSVAGVLCVALAGLILAIIGLGFGPLRVWLEVADRVSPPAPGSRGPRPAGEGIVGLWRLAHGLERVRPSGRRPGRGNCRGPRSRSEDRDGIGVAGRCGS